MAQVFSPAAVLGLKLLWLGILAALVAAAVVYRVNARTDAPAFAAIEQPVPFSHKHHVGDDGIDCRYCHVSVETSAFAGIPPLATCMTCHSQLYTDQAALAPLVSAFQSNIPLHWQRVHH